MVTVTKLNTAGETHRVTVIEDRSSSLNCPARQDTSFSVLVNTMMHHKVDMTLYELYEAPGLS